MKKFTALMLLCLLLAAPFALAEGGDSEGDDLAGAQPGSVALVGMYMSEEELLERIREFITLDERLDPALVEQIVYTQSLNEAILMFKSGRADYILTLIDTANYVAAKNADAQALKTPFVCSLRMVAMKDNQEFVDQVNSALATLRSGGAIERLYGEWVQKYVLEDPKPVEMPVIEGAPTMVFGVSGDIPPVDYVAADGTPAGFNVALLAELSKAMNVNFELMVIDGGARFTALASGRIDAFFWHQTLQGSERLDGEDTLAISNEYLAVPYAVVSGAQ